MAITANSSEQEVTSGGGVQLFVGLADVKVIGVNPTMQELHDFGIQVRNEPNYLDISVGGDSYNKITFWVQHNDPDLKTRVEFLVKPEAKVSQSGKTQWTNNIGQFAYSESKASEAYEWFKDEGVRKAFNGEEPLMDFIKAFANVANGDDCYLDTWKQVASGDVKEIKELVKAFSDNKVRVLLGVKDGQYQEVYKKYFGRIKPRRDDLFVKKLNDDYGAFNAEYNSNLALEPYSPVTISPNGGNALPESMETEGADEGWV